MTSSALTTALTQAGCIVVLAALVAALHARRLPDAPLVIFEEKVRGNFTPPDITPVSTTATTSALPSSSIPSRSPHTVSSPTSPSSETTTVPMLTLAQTKSQFDAGAAQFVDARRAEDFAKFHIPGAVNLAPADFMQGPPRALQSLTPAIPAIVYCDGGDCDSSKLVASQLAQLGYASLAIFQDGFPAWQKAGYPLTPQPVINR